MPEMSVFLCWPEIWATSITSRPDRSSRGYQPPSLPRFHVASSNLESKEETGKIQKRYRKAWSSILKHWMSWLTSRLETLLSLCLVLRWELDVGPDGEDGEGSWKQEMPDVCQLVQKRRLVLTCKSIASMRTLASPWNVWLINPLAHIKI